MDLKTLREKIKELENLFNFQGGGYSQIRFLVEEGRLIDFKTLQESTKQYHPNKIDTFKWLEYLKLCEQYYYGLREQKFDMLANASDEETLSKQNQKIKKLSDTKLFFEEYMKKEKVLRYLEQVKDDSTLALKNTIRLDSTTRYDMPIVRNRDEVIDTIITNQTIKIKEVGNINLSNATPNFNGISYRQLNQLLDLLNEEIVKIQAMSTKEYRKHQISLMQPDPLELQNIMERYFEQLNGARGL